MRLGIDLDNTIIDYARAFAAAAVEAGVTGERFRGKTALRDGLRARPDGERLWQRVQALAYGPLISRAEPYSGVEAFFERARAQQLPIVIVSHKSAFAAGAPAGPNLRECAEEWLAIRGFVRDGLPAVYFEDTRAKKCARIAALELTHFVDDLVEVFADPGFPAGCARWLFAPDGVPSHAPADRAFAAWADLSEAAFC